jgi:ketosteroid isomerase-like protein
MRTRWSLILCSALCLAASAQGQPPNPTPEDPAHAELRALRSAMIEAFNKRDLDGMLKHLHKDVVVTWQNAEVSRGHAGVKAYYDRTMVGDKSIVVEARAEPEVTDLSILYGSPPHTAVAYGKLNDSYKLRDGSDIAMNSVFSVVLVKEDGRWQIVNYHASTNLFDNPLTKLAVLKSMTIAGLGGVAIGALVGLLLAIVFGRMRRKTS